MASGRWLKFPPVSSGHFKDGEFILLKLVMTEKWKVEVWFPPNFVKDPDFEYSTTSDIDFSLERKRIWPNTILPVLTIPYFVNNSNWPGWIEGKVPTVKIKISTENAPPWEEEISIKDIQKF